MILQKHTEKELLAMVAKLQQQVNVANSNSKAMLKKMDVMQSGLDKKPNVIVKETIIKEVEKPVIKEAIIKEIEKPTIINKTIVETDKSVLPTLKKLSDRLKILEDKPPQQALPITETTLKESDILEIITRHVTMPFINKLYKKGK